MPFCLTLFISVSLFFLRLTRLSAPALRPPLRPSLPAGHVDYTRRLYPSRSVHAARWTAFISVFVSFAFISVFVHLLFLFLSPSHTVRCDGSPLAGSPLACTRKVSVDTIMLEAMDLPAAHPVRGGPLFFGTRSCSRTGSGCPWIYYTIIVIWIYYSKSMEIQNWCY